MLPINPAWAANSQTDAEFKEDRNFQHFVMKIYNMAQGKQKSLATSFQYLSITYINKGKIDGLQSGVTVDVADPVESNCEACPSLSFWED